MWNGAKFGKLRMQRQLMGECGGVIRLAAVAVGNIRVYVSQRGDIQTGCRESLPHRVVVVRLGILKLNVTGYAS